jgi:hypothetical protein
MNIIILQQSYLEGLLKEGGYFSQRVEGFDFIEDVLAEIL